MRFFVILLTDVLKVLSFEGISKVLEVSVNELLKGEYIEQENEEVENNKNIILLLNEIQKLKRNKSLVGGLCALLISYITVIYSAIYKPGIKAYEQFFAAFIKAISAGCLVTGILLIFNAWVKYSIRNSNKDKRKLSKWLRVTLDDGYNDGYAGKESNSSSKSKEGYSSGYNDGVNKLKSEKD